MKQKTWWKQLLRIPLMLVIDIVIMIGCLLVDAALFSDGGGSGHGFPVFTLIAFFLLLIITVIVFIVSMIDAIKAFHKQKKMKEDGDPSLMEDGLPKKEERVFDARYLIAIPVQIIFSIALFTICFLHEVNTFYNRPDHIGFAIPIFSLMLGAFLFVVTVIVIIVALVLAKRGKKRP